jgi:hypothetical protein
MAETIEQMARELLDQQIRENPKQFIQKKGVPTRDGSMKPIDPNTLATIGGLADAASTYYFTKSRKAPESNALIGFTGSHPEATALAALGGLAASKGITALLRKVSPKLANAVAANLGAMQLSYSVGNINADTSQNRWPRGFNKTTSGEYQRVMQDNVTRRK